MDFSTLMKSLQSVVGNTMGAFNCNELFSSHSVLGCVYFATFFLSFSTVFVNFYVVILENSFRECKLLLEENMNKQKIMKFSKKKLRSLFTVKKMTQKRKIKVKKVKLS